MNKTFCIFSFFLSFTCYGQFTTPEQLRKNTTHIQHLQKESLVKNIPLQNIGPTIMGGRVVDIEVNTANPSEFYVGYASGGLWHTTNNGTSFIPVMDSSITQNIGDIAVDWDSATIWIGTGENNSSRSSYAGIGILKSTDKGKNWVNVGLTDSHHIGKILINPENSNEVIVGALGHLYSTNKERGLFKTKDGGKTWEKTLYINDSTGIIDIVSANNDFNIMYAATWQKNRKAWHFTGSGSGSGIYKSLDAGETWEKISTSESGFPIGKGIGRIGLAVFNEEIIYALVDNQNRRQQAPLISTEGTSLTKNDFKEMTIANFLKLENKKLNAFLKSNNFQEKYRAENVKQMVRSGVVKPKDITKYLESANSLLFHTPVIGAEVYKSIDGGKTWEKKNKNPIDDFYYSYGYYFGEIRVNSMDENQIYLGGVSLISSKDSGESFYTISRENVHSDHQALWINPNKKGHIINGNDGGLNMSYDDGKNWDKLNSTPVGQFYSINVDNQEPYHVYGGLQDNGVWTGPHNTSINKKWQQTGEYPWKSIMGGDGMQIQIDSRNCNLLYTGYQFGNYYKINRNTQKKTYIQPKHQLGEAPYRFNWQTPILLSPHNQDILYLGSNKLHRSLNQGKGWETLSPDVTYGGKIGNVAYGTITTISESPFKFGQLYIGTDDGLIQLSKNSGSTWSILSKNLPEQLWVSRVVASQHNKERVYACLNGYRNDDFTPYVYKSNDYGNTWEPISGNLPLGAINSILEDSENEHLLYLGTDNGLYVSLDQGDSWQLMQNGMPNVAVHDLVLQEKAKHLLIATHGRSIYKADVSCLQKYSNAVKRESLTMFASKPITHSIHWGNPRNSWKKAPTPGIDFTFYTPNKENYTGSILTKDNIVVSSTEITTDAGFNILSFDVAFSKKGEASYIRKQKKELKKATNGKTYLPKGQYFFILENKIEKQQISFKIE